MNSMGVWAGLPLIRIWTRGGLLRTRLRKLGFHGPDTRFLILKAEHRWGMNVRAFWKMSPYTMKRQSLSTKLHGVIPGDRNVYSPRGEDLRSNEQRYGLPRILGHNR
jgi:hypothetical protein